MSLRGRYVIDTIKNKIGRYLRLPVPPYNDPNYWEKVYKNISSNDCFEWGNITYTDDLKRYKYKLIQYDIIQQQQQIMDTTNVDDTTSEIIETDLYETLGCNFYDYYKPIVTNNGIISTNHDDNSNNEDNEDSTKNVNERPILILGCGNSQFGEEMVKDGWNSNNNNIGPIVQVDVSSRIIDAMTERCNEYIITGDMIIIQDDAIQLSVLTNETIYSVFDKGLIDAIYCTDDYKQCKQIINTIHRILKPNSIFSFLSYTQPKFILSNIIISNPITFIKRWKSIEIRQIISNNNSSSEILLYRLKKAGNNNNNIISSLKKSRH